MIKVLINGINGRMGQELVNIINEMPDFNIVAGVDKNTYENTIPVYSEIKQVKEVVDVIIDFSVPEATLQALEFAKEKTIPIVIATTGFTNKEKEKILDYSKYIPIFQSGNMSFEINIMCDVVSKLARQLEGSDIEIIETHHKNKIDSPSGTALMLAESINNALDNKMEYTYDRHEIKQKRKDNEIGIHSIRGGTEVGKHTVTFFGDNESFEITHSVNSRRVFAKGAIKAAKFIIEKNAGLYNMKNLIQEMG